MRTRRGIGGAGTAAAAWVRLCAGAALFAGLGLAAPVSAQPKAPDTVASLPTPPVVPEAEKVGERKREIEAELDTIARDIKTSAEREAQIRLEIEALEKDRVRLSEQLVAATARSQTLEGQVSRSEARIGAIEAEASGIKASLAGRRAVLAEVLASLQRIGRKPPPALVVRPEDALASIRSAILFGALLPELREQAERLVVDLDRLIRLRDQSASERDRFRADLGELAEEKSRLALLFEERRRAKGDQQRRLDEERRRAGDLAQRATNLNQFIARLESEIDSARKAADAARKADEDAKAKPDQKTVTAVPPDSARMQPAIPFADAKGRLALPAAGQIVKNFGDDDGLGGTLKGLQIATRPEARVSSPSDGWIVYAGPFRSYGKLLIINGGGGYHVVLAGMDRIDVEIGQFVLAGEPVGTMGTRGATAAFASAGPITVSQPGVSDATTGQPLLYVEFRKANATVDPSPWWAQSRDEKVRG